MKNKFNADLLKCSSGITMYKTCMNIYLSSIDLHGEVLPFDQHDESVELSISDLYIAEHGRHGIVSNVIAHSDPTPEHFHRGVLSVAPVVQDHSLALSSS